MKDLNSLVRVMKNLNKNFEAQKHKINPLPFKLDKFDGKTGSQLKPFLAKFEILARRCQWNDDMKVDMLKCNLTGAAAQLLWDDPSCQSYEQLVLKLNQRFGEENQAECFRAKLKVRKQGKDESLSSLMQDIRRMMMLAYPDSSSELGKIMAKDCFLDAIYDKNLSLKIREHSPADLDAAFQLAVKFEAYAVLSGAPKGEDRYRGGMVQTVASSDQGLDPADGRSMRTIFESQNNLFEILKSQGDQILMLSKLVQDLSASSSASQNREQLNNLPSSKKQVKCFGCGEVGHILPKCVHKKNNENRNGSNSGSAADPDSAAVVSTISGALIIHARINGRVYPCLIDTGSEVTIINESLVRPDEIKDSNRTLRAANGSSIKVAGVVDLPLFVGRHQFQSSFVVSPQIRNVILGLDWLETHGCLIDCKNMTLIVGNQRFKLGHVNIARKGPVNCRILKASGKISGPVNPKICKTSVPGETESPVFPTELDGVRPRRVILKPKHLTNDYVCNLFLASSNPAALRCHLCLHPPFACRKMWKGHLFVVHGVKSAKTKEISSSFTVNSSPLVETVEHDPEKVIPTFENISEDEEEKLKTVDEGCAMVASIYCGPPSTSGTVDPVEDAAEMNIMAMDESTKVRELNIISTLLRKVREIGQPAMSAELVSAMKSKFPEMSTERIFALFQWTTWMSGVERVDSAADPSPDAAIPAREEEETYSRNIDPPASSDAPMDHGSHRWDPMLSDPAAGGTHDVVSGSESDDGTFEEIRHVDSRDDRFSLMPPDVNIVGLNNDVEVMFPELHQIAEDDFDLCD